MMKVARNMNWRNIRCAVVGDEIRTVEEERVVVEIMEEENTMMKSTIALAANWLEQRSVLKLSSFFSIGLVSVVVRVFSCV